LGDHRAPTLNLVAADNARTRSLDVDLARRPLGMLVEELDHLKRLALPATS